MSQFVDLFGEKLLNKDGEVDTAEALSNKKAVALYFSAHWCPPCKEFTPILADKYNQLKEAGKELEIVFVSHDQEESVFVEYFAEMPWLAIPFSRKDKIFAVGTKYYCDAIPQLVFVDGDTVETITRDGKSKVLAESFIENFPYKAAQISDLESWRTDLFGEKLNKKGTIAETIPTLSTLDYIMVYFSAHWCPPCKIFTPILCKRYTELKEAGKNFEIIFASSDKTEEEFNEYYNEMPWMALPFEDRKQKDALAKFYACNGIPNLIVIDAKTGEAINFDGRGALERDDFLEAYPYLPNYVFNVTESMDGISDRLFYGVLDGSVMEFSWTEKKPVFDKQILDTAIYSLTKTPDNKSQLVCDTAGNFKELDIPTLNEVKTFDIKNAKYCVFSHDNQLLISHENGNNGAITIWSVETKEQLHTSEFPIGAEVRSQHISQDNKYQFSGYMWGIISIFDLQNYEYIVPYKEVVQFNIHSIAFSKDNQTAFISDYDGNLRKITWQEGATSWDDFDFTKELINRDMSCTKDICLSKDEKYIVQFSSRILILSSTTFEVIKEIFPDDPTIEQTCAFAYVHDVKIIQDGKKALIAFKKGMLAIFDLETLELKHIAKNITKGKQLEQILLI